MSNVSESQGWTSQPGGRGSLDILWSCATTIFLCCWTALCLNVPPSGWNSWRILRQKLYMTCLGIIGPEFVFQLALGQWVSARRSVKAFRDLAGSDHLEYLKWTMTHAFYADMGGFLLKTPDWQSFPVDAKQILYLVEKDYISAADVILDESILLDKNKCDGMVRFITVSQILWFLTSCLGRALQHLVMTTLELTTLGFILCSLGTFVCWAQKPKDVMCAIVIKSNTDLSDILKRAGEAAKEPYKYTPLDFVGRDKSSWILYWTYWMNILRSMGIVFASKQRPINKIPDDFFRDLTGQPWFCFLLYKSHTPPFISPVGTSIFPPMSNERYGIIPPWQR
jgi:hypothetical protein